MGVVLLDRVARADASAPGSAESLQPWVALSGATWAVVGTALQLSNNTSQAVLLADVGVAPLVGDLYADVLTTPTAQRLDAGMTFCAIDASNYLLLTLTNTVIENGCKLWKNVAGAFTQLASSVALPPATNTTYRVRVTLTATTVTCYLNGTLLFSYTLTSGEQTTFNAATKVGPRVNWNVGGGTGGDDRGTKFRNLVFVSATGSYGTVPGHGSYGA